MVIRLLDFDDDLITILDDDQKINSSCWLGLIESSEGTADVQGSLTSKWNSSVYGYLFNDVRLYLNPNLGVFLNLSLQCSLLLNYTTDNQTLRKITLKIKTKKCQLGQEYQISIGVCKTCPQYSYSFEANPACKKCLTPGMQFCYGGSNTSLDQGYWRVHIYSE